MFCLILVQKPDSTTNLPENLCKVGCQFAESDAIEQGNVVLADRRAISDHILGVYFMASIRSIAGFLLGVVAFSLPVSAQQPQSPGKEHEELKALEGEWEAVLQMPDGTEMKGSSEFKMTCGGMWLESNFKGDLGGFAFHGRGLDSYDSARKLYTSIWVDSMSGSPMILTGTKEGKVTTMTGEGPGPAGTAKYKTVSTQESVDKMTFKMSMGEGKEEMEMMTVTYTRKKK